MESTHELELFIKPSCPYCKKVMRYMAVHTIEIPLSDITSNPEAAEKLIEVGGKCQVPACLLTVSRCMNQTILLRGLTKTFFSKTLPISTYTMAFSHTIQGT